MTTSSKVKLLGKGAFTRAYLLDNDRVRLESRDPIKECMAHGWFPESRLFAEVQQIDDGVYEMEYFPRVSSLKKTLNARDWALYQTLRTMADVYHCRTMSLKNKALMHGELHKVIDEFDAANAGYEDEFQALREAVDGCCNYGTDIGFEISPRNVAVKGDELILLDVFFIRSHLAA